MKDSTTIFEFLSDDDLGKMRVAYEKKVGEAAVRTPSYQSTQQLEYFQDKLREVVAEQKARAARKQLP